MNLVLMIYSPILMLLFTKLNKIIKYDFKLNRNIALLLSFLIGVLAIYIYKPFSSNPVIEYLVILSALTTLLNISIIDIEQMIIPDTYNLILVGLGLLHIIFVTPSPLFLIIGVLSFSSFFILNLTSKGSLGMGDVKMAFGLGLFLDLNLFVRFVMYSFGIGAIIALIMILTKTRNQTDRLPFGPLMATGFALSLLI